jgi:hypothetical protein
VPGEVTRRLRRRVDLLSDELGLLRQRRAEQEPLPEHVQSIFAYGEALLLADLGRTSVMRAAPSPPS